MTKSQLESIPYIESFISSGFIDPVYTDKDYDRLPPHIFTTGMQRKEAEFAMAPRTAMVPEDQAVAQELGDADDSRVLAAKEAKIDAKNLAKNYVRPVNPNEVKTEEETKKEQDEALKEMREKENVLSIPDQTPADEQGQESEDTKEK